MSEVLRVVVDITGGAIHAVYCGKPVDVVFISSDRDDIGEGEGMKDYVDPDGDAVALWTSGSQGDDHDIVDHYFAQSEK